MKKKKLSINSIDLKLFKGFKDSKVEFSPGLNLLVGGNNSGKSSLLQAIYLGFYFLKLTDGISNQDKKKAKTENHLQGTTVKSIPLPFHEDAYISEGLKRRSRRENSTKISLETSEDLSFSETVTFPGGNPLVISSNTKGQTGSVAYQKNIKKFIKGEHSSPLFIPTFSGVTHREEQKTPGVVKYYITSGKSSEVLRNQLGAMSKVQMREVNEYLSKSFGYEIVSSTEKEIHLSTFYKEGENNSLDISSAGSGFQQILQILVYIVISKSEIILIDEPDAHLHYKLQNILYMILSDLSKKGKQIIVATHSQVFIKKAVQNGDRLLLVDKNLTEQKAISEYTEAVRVLYENGLIDENEITTGASLKVVGIEDGSDGFKIIQEFFNKIGIHEPEYKFVSNGGGNNSVAPYVLGKEKIEKIKIKAIELRDNDSMGQEFLDQVVAKESKKDVFSLFFLDVHEVENYLIDANVLTRVLKSKECEGVTLFEVKKLIEDVATNVSNRDYLIDTLGRVLNGQLLKLPRDIAPAFNRMATTAADRVADVRDNHYTYPYKLLPGKELFKMIKKELQKKYGVSVSEPEVAQNFTKNEVPTAIKDAVRFFA